MMPFTREDFERLEAEHTEWLSRYHNATPIDPSRPRPVVPTGTINPLLLSEFEIYLVYRWMLDEIAWFKYQYCS
jgi:hypothetical protein